MGEDKCESGGGSLRVPQTRPNSVLICRPPPLTPPCWNKGTSNSSFACSPSCFYSLLCKVGTAGMSSSDSSASASSTSTPSNARIHKPSSTPLIAGTLAGCMVVIACVLTFILIRKRRQRLLTEYASHFAAAADRTNFPREHENQYWVQKDWTSDYEQ